MIRVAIIIGSARPGRKAEAVARWVHEIASKRGDAEYELVDIQDYNLPLLDEPIPPSQGKYSQEHTKVWSAKIASFDAYVFVTPEYNHGSRARSRTPSTSSTASGTTRRLGLSATAAETACVRWNISAGSWGSCRWPTCALRSRSPFRPTSRTTRSSGRPRRTRRPSTRCSARFSRGDRDEGGERRQVLTSTARFRRNGSHSI